MKTITMFETSWCPHCKQAHKFMDELMNENPRYKNLKIQIIDEELEPEVANSYDYYYVPTYYLDSEKVHEGVPNKKAIELLFNNALS
ncbi:glutaredoxin [Anaerocolumna sedimenticola]|uniref:Glutaredoxin n=1 Tax=Anaerocolumna sedimenticola TaxID=2696063 RepID=A0A6P1TGS7_9FIRM|nr:thioredoxin family protein [Anaerocolumna sedimenticola]QHQ59497.1 glutaredoxin [Anaerocolumna sedimenticola]